MVKVKSTPGDVPAPAGYALELVWEEKSEALRREIVAFWLEHGALPSQQAAEARASQVACVVRDASGALCGVSTVYQQVHPRFGVAFHYFRCFVAAEHRRANLASNLVIAVARYFEERFKAGHDPEVLGVFMEVQNAFVQKNMNQAVWPIVPFVFVGRNQRGDQERVFFFEGAQL